MVTGYIFTAFLVILGLAVMRFGSIHFKKFKEGKTKIKSIEWLYLAAKGHRRAKFNLENNKDTWLVP